MTFKKLSFNKILLLILCLNTFFSCEDDIREVTLFEKGTAEAATSASVIKIGETIDFSSTSTKAHSAAWTFDGGSPASSVDPNVTVSYAKKGTYEAKLTVMYIDNQVETKTFIITVEGLIPDPLPYGGSPISIPATIEAENYDLGGQGIAYNDTEEENLAVTAGSASYREDDGIDIEVGTSVTKIGFAAAGEWMNYTIDVAEAGSFDFSFNVASGDANGGKSIKIHQVNLETGELTDLGETGDFTAQGWSTYKNIVVSAVNLEAGLQTLRFEFTGGNTNFDNVTIAEASDVGDPINGLGFYTERITTETNTMTSFSNEANFIISEVGGAAEGNNALFAKFDPVNSSTGTAQTYGGLLTLYPTSTLNLSEYAYWNISLKAPAENTKNLRLRVNTSGGNYWVVLSTSGTDALYGFTRDGQWHDLKIPLSDLLKDGTGQSLDADKANVSVIRLRTDDADFNINSNFDWYIDDIYFTPAEVETLGFYTERETTLNNSMTSFSNEANFIITEVGSAAEGSKALFATFDPVNSTTGTDQTYGGLLTLYPTSLLNLSDYTYWNIALKAPAENNKNLRLRVNTSGGNYWVVLSTSGTDELYGFTRDDQWHNLKIPLSDLLKDGTGIALDADKANISVIRLRTDDSDFNISENFDWYMDDIYFIK